MPRVLLTIRDEDRYGTSIILQSDKGLATILSALAGAVRVDSDESYQSPPRVILGKEITAETKRLPKSTRFCVREGETFVEVDVDDPQRVRTPRINGRKPLALNAPSAQRELRLGNGRSR